MSYHRKEFTAKEQNYWSQRGEIVGEWQGKLATHFGLAGAVSADDFAKLSQGQHPATGEQLVRQRASYEYQDADGKTIKTMEHRAGWDATFSAPKSVSLTALVDSNPIKLVRQSAKREKVPDVLELAELQILLSRLSVRERTLVLLDAATGLRVSELLAIRWSDVDFENLELRVTRSIWHQVVGRCKTEASAKPVPMDDYMAEDLLNWRRLSPYPLADDYVFASPTMRGAQPYWPDNLMKRHILPVAREAGIHKNIGWHTFRHSFATLLKANGEDVKTVQELLRHATSRITLDVYTQAVNSTKRAAQSKVVKMMVSDVGQKRDQKYPQTVQ
ncbi:MAG: relaxase domain-containing protein [Terracidiphilus sp.]